VVEWTVTIYDARCAQSVRNNSLRYSSELHQSRGDSKCKS